jgi:rod shape determining protein RodA
MLMVAQLAARLVPGRLRLLDALPIVAVVAAPVVLILRQDDTGTALTFLPLLSAVLFVAGLRWRWIVLALALGAALAPVGWSELKPYQQDRLRIFVNPELDASGKGYHAIQSRIAVGSGGITGRGYTEGPQNRLGFLPERHTDYIFAIVAEEWGFLGAVLVLALYLLVLARLAEGAARATDRAGAFACLGVMSFFAVHVIVNVGMALALLPTIGIPLPFLSYGGTALLAGWAMVGVAASVPTRIPAR